MYYKVVNTSRFKKAYKRVRDLKGFKRKVFEEVVTTLAEGRKLGPKYKDHQLSGKLKNFRECHVAPDILLIYQTDEEILVLVLVTIGNHSQLF